LDEQIGMRTSPEEIAKEMLRAHQKAQGMIFDDPDAKVDGYRKQDGVIIPYQPESDEEIKGRVMGGA